jgi:hypothetical protein
MADDLGQLINDLNPYTENQQAVRGALTGAMDIYTGAVAPAGAAPLAPQVGPQRAQVRLETDTKYQSEWLFKGQPHRVGKAVRVRYRFPVMDAAGVNVVHWVEDHLLIGFEGSNSG